jgi:hypothetical protein
MEGLMEKRLAKLEVIWRYDGTRTVSPQEVQLTGQLVHALTYPSACAAPTAEAQLAFFHATVAGSRLSTAAVSGALIAALVRCEVAAEDAEQAVRVGGVEAMLHDLAEHSAEGAAWQRAARERAEREQREAEAAKKTRARAAYFATHPWATDRHFEVEVWPKWHWRFDDLDELAAAMAAAE